jgi:hypothetical protein
VSRDFDDEIGKKAKELEGLRAEMRDATIAWLDTAAPYFEDYWIATARDIVLKQAEHSQAISASKVQALRAQVEALAATSRVYVQRRLVDERHDRWPHLAPQTEPDDRMFGDGAHRSAFNVIRSGGRAQTPTPLGEAFGQVLADVNEIIGQYGYSVSTVSRFTEDQRLSIPAHSHPSWTEDMVTTMGEYTELHERYIMALLALRTIEREKAEAAAADMWGE